ncbi:MAG: hypothetical protein EPO02_12965 [Nitrospirae bacterium]|nr:MAG: hypothetical protein EPO02_12965 [Nitrospirota bacterium]
MAKNKAAAALGKMRAKAGDLADVGSLGGLARAKKQTPQQLSDQARIALRSRWRNYYAGEHALHGTPIPDEYAAAVATMTKAEIAKAKKAAERRKAKKEKGE